MTDWLLKCTDVWKKQTYWNGWPKERLPWSKNTPKKNHPPQLWTYNVPTNDVENINRTNKGGYLVFTNNPRTALKEQKGCWKWTRGTSDLLCIDQHILKDSKMKRKHLAMAWIDYKNAYDVVPPNCIIECLKIYKISDKVIRFILNTMKKLESGNDNRRKLNWGIFLGNTLSPLLFVIAMMPLNHILKKCTDRCKLDNSQEKINHLIYVDDIKLFPKIKKNWKP